MEPQDHKAMLELLDQPGHKAHKGHEDRKDLMAPLVLAQQAQVAYKAKLAQLVRQAYKAKLAQLVRRV
jgi:hypothetical protein